MTLANTGQTNHLLGYPADARLLIVNADDFGMCHAVNQAIIQTLEAGLVSSCSLMVPCPWRLHGLKLLRATPEVSVGVHLTAISEQPDLRWGPLSCRNEVPSLVDQDGFFYPESRIDELLDQVDLAELAHEFRAQIELVLAAGVRPTHLDSHCGVHTRREAIFAMVLNLARDYGLGLRVSGRPLIEQLQQQGLPTNDHDLMDSYDLDPSDKSARYAQMLRDLPVGLSEWAIHPGIGDAELRAFMPSWQVRQTDYDFFLSQAAWEIVREEGITIVSYKALQAVWHSAA